MTVTTDADRPLSTPRIRPDVPACEAWCDQATQIPADREREHLTYATVSCSSEALFIPYANGAPVVIDREDRELEDYPPVVPAYIKSYLVKKFGRDTIISVSMNDESSLDLRLSEAVDLVEVLTRLLQAARTPA